MEYISKNTEETKKIAESILAKLNPSAEATVLALDGDLGSGKTTFSQFIGDNLGVKDAMQSPTFVIQKIYNLTGQKWHHLVHIDAYRLEKPQELSNLSWEEVRKDPGNIVLIEWADRVRQILPKSAIHIVFKHAEDSENPGVRRIEVSSL